MIVAFVVLCLVSFVVNGQECESYEEYTNIIKACEKNCDNPVGGCTVKMSYGERECRCAPGLYRSDRTGVCVKMDDCYDYSSESQGN